MAKDKDGNNFVTDDNTGGYFVAECEECGLIFNSGNAGGSEPIADTGDYGDVLCPGCNAIDPPECDNPNAVWNAQQEVINNLAEALDDIVKSSENEMHAAIRDTTSGIVDGSDIYEQAQAIVIKARAALSLIKGEGV